MASVYEIIQGIHQAAANGYDGSNTEGVQGKGESHEIGLVREEGDVILDSRVMDGFKVATMGNLMKLTYTTDNTMKEVRNDKFEDEIVERIEDVVKFLKKEYKKVTGSSLSLKMKGEPKVDVQHQNRLRTWTTAHCIYEVGGIDEKTITADADAKKFQDSFKKWSKAGSK